MVASPSPYGAEHQKIRAGLLARLRPGEPCPRCGRPMYPWQRLHAGHSQDVHFYPTAKADRLEHESCNTSDGARVGNRSRQMNPSRKW